MFDERHHHVFVHRLSFDVREEWWIVVSQHTRERDIQLWTVIQKCVKSTRFGVLRIARPRPSQLFWSKERENSPSGARRLWRAGAAQETVWSLAHWRKSHLQSDPYLLETMASRDCKLQLQTPDRSSGLDWRPGPMPRVMLAVVLRTARANWSSHANPRTMCSSLARLK